MGFFTILSLHMRYLYCILLLLTSSCNFLAPREIKEWEKECKNNNTSNLPKCVYNKWYIDYFDKIEKSKSKPI